MLFAIGAGDRIVGVSSFDKFPPEVEWLPRLGGLLDPNVERLLALKPDLAIVYDTQADLKAQLTAAGIPLFGYVHRGLPDVTQTIRVLGDRLGLGSQSRDVADRIERDLAAVRARVAGRPRPKTLLIFGREPGSLRSIDASGGYGFLHDLLETAGGDDVLADIHRESVRMSTEMVLARRPEVIVELQYGSSPRESDAVDVWRTLPAVPAVKTRRIYVLHGDEFVVPGPRIVIGARKMAERLHPDAFK
jgi:iron complex transport system substrate-binding protein